MAEILGSSEHSLRTKLTGIVFITCGAAILLACAIFAVYDIVTFQSSLKKELVTVAEITGSNTRAALAFGDARGAREILNSLRAQTHIVEGCVYEPNESILARYARDESDKARVFPRPESDRAEIRGDSIVVFRTIRLNGDRIGTIYIKSDLKQLSSRVARFAEIFLVVIFLSLSTAYVLSSNLQRSISEPILELARAAFAVSLHKDYSIRATRHSKDEIGFLYDRFNEMMSQIQRRERELHRAHANLELSVDERTKELQREVAERKQAQHELAERTDFLNSLIQNSPLAIIVTNPEHKVEMCNPAFESLFARRQADIVGQTIEQIVGTPAQESVRIGEKVVRGEQVHFAAQRKRSDGSMIDVELYVVPLCGKEKIGRVLTMYHDLTERVRAEEALVRAKDAAEAASRAKSEFLANMSHEIRTPMNGVIGMTDLALCTELSSEQREYLSMVKASAHSLLGILNDILDFSKIEAGKLDLEIAGFSLRQSLGETLKAFEFSAHQKGLQLTWRVNDDVPDGLEGDVGRLRQVLINLVGNALKFTQAGEVSVEVEQSQSSPSGALLHFRVRDTGIGIPDEKRTLIFDPFTQADNSTTRRYGGTGLGLSICARLVELMGGEIWVDTRVGNGSTFHFTARVGVTDGQRATALQDSGGQSKAPGRGAEQNEGAIQTHEDGLTVLLAEDNVVNRLVAKRLLEKHGHEVLIAENGIEAVSSFEREREHIDAILMDIQMPEMDGLAAIRAIRTREGKTWGHVPVIALTAHAMKGDREKCLEAGADDYITKPLHTPDLLAALGRARRQKTEAVDRADRTADQAIKGEAQVGHDGVDWAAALKHVDGDRELLAEVARLFAEKWSTTRAELEASFEKHDLKMTELLAHGLKGAAANLGAQGISEPAFHLEKLARAGEYEEARVQWKIVRNGVEHLLMEIDSLFAKVPS
ncbi:MAG TPA: ATP-binding protein [Candidatus Acidoferrum sp.]|nr:ATP-binding protein [Candidatus Acidoferrum sp.]